MSDAAESFTPLDPRQLSVMRIRGLIAAAAATAIALVIDLTLLRETPILVGAAPLAVGAFGIAGALILPRRRYRAWGYRLEEDELHIRAGLWVRWQTVVPFARVQHIDVSHGPIERSFGLGRLILHTAGTRTAAVGLPGLEQSEAERIRDLIRGKIRQETA